MNNNRLNLNNVQVKVSRAMLLKCAVALIIFLGWFFSAWGGGIMGLWACFCTGVVGYCFGSGIGTSIGAFFTRDRTCDNALTDQTPQSATLHERT